MAQSFNSVTGGLVSSVVANVGNSVSASIQNIGNPNPSTAGWASVAVNSLLSSTIETSTGYALNAGENYLLSQLGSVLPPGENNALANAVITQVAAAGISQVSSFVSEGIGNLLNGGAPDVTTAGAAGQAGRSSKSIPDSVASQLPQADYGGTTYTLDDIVFTLVPANAGAQTAPQPQSPPTVPTSTGFTAAAAASVPAVDALKTAAALAGPAVGAAASGKNPLNAVAGAAVSAGVSALSSLPGKF